MKALRAMRMTMLLTGVATACQSTSEPDGAPAITGWIVVRNATIPAGSPSIHVKETLATPCGIVFRMGLTTRVLRRSSDGKITRASQSDLSVGKQVRVWAGAIAESCPGQGTAEVVEIIE